MNNLVLQSTQLQSSAVSLDNGIATAATAKRCDYSSSNALLVANVGWEKAKTLAKNLLSAVFIKLRILVNY